ncbi:MAG TPA: ATP-binding protein [Candidatus Avilachnospira avistercoris]|nr:ATP-binding protein [Candidatus Avilachnospira avistercoris]
MALTREQYNRIMRIYDERRRRSEEINRGRQDEAYERVPRLKECSDRISANAVAETRAFLSGDRALAVRLREESAGLISEKKRLLKENGYPEDYLEPVYECPCCRDTGYVGTEKCSCLRKMESELIYMSSGLPKILKKENFEHFDLSVFDDEKTLSELAPKLVITQRGYMEEIVLPKVQSFLTSFFKNGAENLLMTGPSGTGKTFLSNCIANEAIERCRGLLYESAAEMFEKFSKESFRHGEDEALSGRIKEIYDCELLIIDDLGTEVASAFTESRLFMLLTHRLKTGRSTIISSNLSLNQMSRIYGERIVSRIMESYVLIPFYGSDLRLRGGMRR